MKSIHITPLAQEDIDSIWLYIYQNWSEKQADKYLFQIDRCIKTIQSGYLNVKETPLHDVKRYKCEHHYIFFTETDSIIVIIAILGERMDLINRLKERL